MTHRRRHTQGLPDNANPNAVDGLIRAEMVRMKVKFSRPKRRIVKDLQGRDIEIVEQVDTSVENVATVRAHVAEAKGQGTPDEKPTVGPGGELINNCRKHWRLSTLEFLVDDDDNITHFICARD